MYFNRKLTIQKATRTVNSIWEWEAVFSTINTDIDAIVKLNKIAYDKMEQTQGAGLEYLKSSHKIRLEFWPEVKTGYKILDDKGFAYIIKYVHISRGFNGDDHNLLYCDVIEENVE